MNTAVTIDNKRRLKNGLGIVLCHSTNDENPMMNAVLCLLDSGEYVVWGETSEEEGLDTHAGCYYNAHSNGLGSALNDYNSRCAMIEEMNR